ncbi:MAG: hypothetical protein HYV05_00970 [Deltaproteobacteria bacterium]|nr:hypothetical protein [Deltaproteobacteria bacterium]MBI2209779.1 hypothetical protein [Deltaproteobacteria bacterium]MBI2347203.1 hypothetical protein [Deltaproteobacteria bacterium]MBI2538997.1 hypothetical protein [Deltaproteobacteria bacterium]
MMSGAVIGRGFGLGVLLILSWKVLVRGISVEPPGLLLTILDGANLIFHEAGHVILLPFGEFIHYLGGSLMQVAIPATCAAYFWLHEQRSSAAAALFWTGESVTNVAIYVADARRMELPLIGGDHDWNYLLDRLNLLNQAESLGRFVFVVGVLTICAGLVLLTSELVRHWNEPQPDE